MSDENKFRTTLCNKLKSAGIFTQKIEARDMGRGIPDMLMVNKEGLKLIELKDEDCKLDLKADHVIVHWRPGQQAWAHELYISSKQKECVTTIIQYTNCYVLINMTKYFEYDAVYSHEYLRFDTIKELLNYLDYLA